MTSVVHAVRGRPGQETFAASQPDAFEAASISLRTADLVGDRELQQLATLPEPDLAALGLAVFYDDCMESLFHRTERLGEAAATLLRKGEPLTALRDQAESSPHDYLNRLMAVPSDLLKMRSTFRTRMEQLKDPAFNKLSELSDREDWELRLDDLEHYSGNLQSGLFSLSSALSQELDDTDYVVSQLEFFSDRSKGVPNLDSPLTLERSRLARKDALVKYAIQTLGIAGEDGIKKLSRKALRNAIHHARSPESPEIDFDFSPGKRSADVAPHYSSVFAIVTELLLNGVEAIPRHQSGRIEVRCARSKRDFSVRVSNTGTIDGTLLDRIFEQGFSTKQGKGGHQGKGLSQAKKMAERVGGSLTVEVDRKDYKTHFNLTVPRNDDPEDKPLKPRQVIALCSTPVIRKRLFRLTTSRSVR